MQPSKAILRGLKPIVCGDLSFDGEQFGRNLAKNAPVVFADALIKCFMGSEAS